MAKPSDTTKKRTFLIAVVVLNLLVLAFLGRYALHSVQRAREQMATGLAWGDPNPWQEPVRTLDDRIVSLRPQAPATTTFLFFIGPTAVDGVQTIARDLAAAESVYGQYQALAIFEGTGEQWKTMAPPDPPGLSIVPDPEGAVRTAFKIANTDGISTTVALNNSTTLDQQARIGLFLNTLVHAGLLLDFLDFRPAEPVISVAGGDRPELQGIAPSHAENELPPRAPYPSTNPVAEPGGNTSIQRIYLKRESTRGAGRIRTGPDETIYAASRRRHRVWRVSPDFQEWHSLGRFGQAPGAFLMPYDLDIDGQGNVFVVERGNLRLQKLSPSGDALLQFPLDPNASSVAALPNGRLAVANAKSGARILRFEESLVKPEPFVEFRSFPWLRDRIEILIVDLVDRRNTFEKSEMALNEVYLESGPSGRLYVLSVWEPILQAYDSKAKLILELPFEFQGLIEKTEEFHQTLDEMLAAGALGVRLIFQDLAIDPAETTAAVVVSGECPGVVLVAIRDQATLELCLLDPEGEPFAPGTIAPTRDGRWLVANELGIFSFKMPDLRTSEEPP